MGEFLRAEPWVCSTVLEQAWSGSVCGALGTPQCHSQTLSPLECLSLHLGNLNSRKQRNTVLWVWLSKKWKIKDHTEICQKETYFTPYTDMLWAFGSLEGQAHPGHSWQTVLSAGVELSPKHCLPSAFLGGPPSLIIQRPKLQATIQEQCQVLAPSQIKRSKFTGAKSSNIPNPCKMEHFSCSLALAWKSPWQRRSLIWVYPVCVSLLSSALWPWLMSPPMSLEAGLWESWMSLSVKLHRRAIFWGAQ